MRPPCGGDAARGRSTAHRGATWTARRASCGRRVVVILPGLLDAADADALCRDALDDFERCRQELVKKGKGDLAKAHNSAQLPRAGDARGSAV